MNTEDLLELIEYFTYFGTNEDCEEIKQACLDRLIELRENKIKSIIND